MSSSVQNFISSMAIIDGAVKNGKEFKLITDSNRDFVLDVLHPNGLHFQHSLTFNEARTCIESSRGDITSLYRPSQTQPTRVNFFKVEGLPSFISSEGALGHPGKGTLYRGLSMTPEESNTVRDNIMLRHDNFETVKDIWNKYR